MGCGISLINDAHKRENGKKICAKQDSQIMAEKRELKLKVKANGRYEDSHRM
jgi:hypothetical protein